jgi:hypothetical protein
MTRAVTGIFRRTDRVRAPTGSTVRLLIGERGREFSATLLELSPSDMLFTDAALPALGSNVSVAITLRGRYLEFELPGLVTWHRADEFGVSFESLTARQTYGLALAIDVLGRAAEVEADTSVATVLAARR